MCALGELHRAVVSPHPPPYTYNSVHILHHPGPFLSAILALTIFFVFSNFFFKLGKEFIGCEEKPEFNVRLFFCSLFLFLIWWWDEPQGLYMLGKHLHGQLCPQPFQYLRYRLNITSHM